MTKSEFIKKFESLEKSGNYLNKICSLIIQSGYEITESIDISTSLQDFSIVLQSSTNIINLHYYINGSGGYDVDCFNL